MRSNRRRAGLTLFEFLVVGSLITLVSAMLLQFSLQHANLQNTLMAQGELRAEAAIALDSMLKELRHTTRTAAASPPNLTIPAAPNNTQAQFYVLVDADGNGVIVDAAGALEWDAANPIQYQYDQAAQQLLRTSGAATRVLANHVTAATFADRAIDGTLPADEVRIRLTLSRTTPHGQLCSTDVNAVVKLRN